MGKHAAADGDARHPVVAAALARRAADLAGAHRGDTQRIEGNLGWPGEPPPGGGGLGWPGDLSPPAPASPPSGEAERYGESERYDAEPNDDEERYDAEPYDDEERYDAEPYDDEERYDAAGEADEDQPVDPDAHPAHDGRRRGWRRLLGLDRAA